MHRLASQLFNRAETSRKKVRNGPVDSARSEGDKIQFSPTVLSLEWEMVHVTCDVDVSDDRYFKCV